MSSQPDNPAGRLYKVLDRINESQRSKNTREAWHEVLEIHKGTAHEQRVKLFRTLAMVLDLPLQISHEMAMIEGIRL